MPAWQPAQPRLTASTRSGGTRPDTMPSGRSKRGCSPRQLAIRPVEQERRGGELEGERVGLERVEAETAKVVEDERPLARRDAAGAVSRGAAGEERQQQRGGGPPQGRGKPPSRPPAAPGSTDRWGGRRPRSRRRRRRSRRAAGSRAGNRRGR